MIKLLKIKFDAAIISYISLFERVTKAQVKDCMIADGLIIFIVEENEMGKALGKHGVNIKSLESNLKKKVKVIEFSPDMIKFIEHIIYPTKAKEIIEDNGKVTIIPSDSRSRGYLIGRNATILRQNESIVKRYFDIGELRVA